MFSEQSPTYSLFHTSTPLRLSYSFYVRENIRESPQKIKADNKFCTKPQLDVEKFNTY